MHTLCRLSYLHRYRSGLEPEFLCKAIYPQLSAFHDLDSAVHAQRRLLTLSSAAIALALSPQLAVLPTGPPTADSKLPDPERIFLMDTFVGLYVLYSHLADKLPLPPPQNCM